MVQLQPRTHLHDPHLGFPAAESEHDGEYTAGGGVVVGVYKGFLMTAVHMQNSQRTRTLLHVV